MKILYKGKKRRDNEHRLLEYNVLRGFEKGARVQSQEQARQEHAGGKSSI